ncbi:unnamed protein product [Choristocarpus tenellus]
MSEKWRFTISYFLLLLALTAIWNLASLVGKSNPQPTTSTTSELNPGSNPHPTHTNNISITSEPTRGPGSIELLFMGRLGNNLFEYATARALADSLGWGLTMKTAWSKPKFGTLLTPEGMKCFPGIRPIDSVPVRDLEVKEFRGVQVEMKDVEPRQIIMRNWFQNYNFFSYAKGNLRQIMAIDRSCCDDLRPGPEDVVIHFRNYRAELSKEQYKKLHFKDLGYSYYRKVLAHISNGKGGPPSKVWMVGQFGTDDPLPSQLREEFGAVLLNDKRRGQFQDFCFMCRANRLVIATSTFSWWAAFLSNATEIHFPLQKRQGVTTANIKVTDEARYIYHQFSGEVLKD